MAKGKMTFDDAKAIIVKHLPEDFFSGPTGEKHKEALSLMGVAFERAKCSNLREFSNTVRKEFADSVIKNICEQVNAPTPSESYVVEKCNQVIDNLVKEMEEK